MFLVGGREFTGTLFQDLLRSGVHLSLDQTQLLFQLLALLGPQRFELFLLLRFQLLQLSFLLRTLLLQLRLLL